MSDAARPNLTGRQWGILGLLADGRSVPEIAWALGVTPRTVRGQLWAIYRALPWGGVANKKVAAVAWYLREGHCRHAEVGGDA